MINVLAAILGVCCLGALLAGWRAWWLFRHWLPAAGHVLESSYTERMQLVDVPPGQGLYTHGRAGLRLVREHVQFEDQDGERQTVWVSRWVTRRYRPFTDYMVWYDPDNARRATAMGPGYWLGLAAVLAGVIIMALIAATHPSGADLLR